MNKMSCLHITSVLFLVYIHICVIQSGMVMKNVEDSDYIPSDDVDTVKAEKILQVKEQLIYIILTMNGLFVSGWKMMKVVIKLLILSMKISTQ